MRLLFKKYEKPAFFARLIEPAGTTNQAGSALNGLGFGERCARSHTGQGGRCLIQSEWAGGKHWVIL
jgi:hypothetical protein